MHNCTCRLQYITQFLLCCWLSVVAADPAPDVVLPAHLTWLPVHIHQLGDCTGSGAVDIWHTCVDHELTAALKITKQQHLLASSCIRQMVCPEAWQGSRGRGSHAVAAPAASTEWLVSNDCCGYGVSSDQNPLVLCLGLWLLLCFHYSQVKLALGLTFCHGLCLMVGMSGAIWSCGQSQNYGSPIAQLDACSAMFCAGFVDYQNCFPSSINDRHKAQVPSRVVGLVHVSLLAWCGCP
jgi:hypothetical protein